MSDINTGTQISRALVKSATWGTSAQAGAGHGIELTSHTLSHKIESIPDNSLGRPHSSGADMGNTRVGGTLESHARYEDLLGIALVGGLAPAPVASGAATFTHTITPADDTDGLFATFVEKRKTYVLEAMLKPTGFTLYGEAGRVMNVRLESAGFDLVEESTTNTVASFASVTTPNTGGRLLYSTGQVRMNADSGAALASGDRIYPNRIEFIYRRNLKGFYTGQYAVTRGSATTDRIDEPVSAGQPTAVLRLHFPVNRDAVLLADFKSDIRKKLDITFTGPSIEPGFNRRFALEIPHAQLSAVTALDSSKGRLVMSAEFNLHLPASAPAGMSGISTAWRIAVTNTLSAGLLS